ncbi:MAG: glycosyltransferase [Caulobacteraceae bacterium]
MKIGLVTHHFYPTNQEVRVEKFSEAFTAAGFGVVVLCPGRYGEKDGPAPDGTPIIALRPASASKLAKAKVIPLPINPVWTRWFTRQFREQGLDLVIVRDLRLALPVFKAARRVGIPAMLDIGEHYPGMMEITGKQHWSHYIIRSQRLIKRLERISVQRADWVWAVVEENRARLAKFNNNVEVISNYPSTMTGIAPRSPCHPYTADGPPVRLLFLGLIDNIRGLDLAIDAFALLLKELPNVEFEIHGDGPFRPTLEAQVKTLGVGDKVKFMGWAAGGDKYRLMARGDLGLILHRMCELCQHTIPNKLFDYMSVGLPVVSTRLRPIQSVLDFEGCGIVVDDNPPAAAAAMAKLILDHDLRKRMAAAGAEAVQIRYGWEGEAERAISRVRALADARPRRTVNA